VDGLNELGRWLLDWPSLLAALLGFFGLGLSGTRLSWSIVQLAVVVLAFSLSVVAARLVTGRLEALVARAHMRPALLRVTAIVLRRTQPILFALLLWLGLAALRTVTWDSNSYFVSLVASLVTALVAITIASRAIRNRSLARLIETGGWILVTLGLLGILPEALALMDQLALQIGDLRISLLLVLQGIVVLWALLWAAGLASRFLERQLTGLDDVSPTHRVLIGTVARTAFVTLALLVGLYAIGIDFTALTFVSGAVGVGLGFGLQKVVSNFVSGIILLTDKSIKPGDVISVGDTFGWISSLNPRYVSVSMRDGREVLIPNEDLITQPVQNWSFADPYVRIEIGFGVSYDSDPHHVRKVAIAATESHPRVTKDNSDFPVVCHVTAFGDSSIDFVLRFFISDPVNGLTNVRGEVFLALWDAFKAEGITIPFPHREVILKTPAGAAEAVAGE
jgi:small-conductance mechanosensitive channel